MADNSNVVWSYSDAKLKCNNRYSCFVEVSTKQKMSLSPYYIGRIKQGVKEQLERRIKGWKYCEELKGIIIAYDNVKLLEKCADIHDDTPLLHFTIQVNYVIFKPEIGKKLLGVVNKTSSSHVGCLVHEKFNASLAKPRDATWPGHTLDIGTHFVFRVTGIQSVAGVLSISGEIKNKDIKYFKHASSSPNRIDSNVDKCLEERNKGGCEETFNDKTSNPPSLLCENEGEISHESSIKKSKKHKKKYKEVEGEKKELDSDVEKEVKHDLESNLSEESERKRKNKSKKKKKKEAKEKDKKQDREENNGNFDKIKSEEYYTDDENNRVKRKSYKMERGPEWNNNNFENNSTTVALKEKNAKPHNEQKQTYDEDSMDLSLNNKIKGQADGDKKNTSCLDVGSEELEVIAKTKKKKRGKDKEKERSKFDENCRKAENINEEEPPLKGKLSLSPEKGNKKKKKSKDKEKKRLKFDENFVKAENIIEEEASLKRKHSLSSEKEKKKKNIIEEEASLKRKHSVA